ncbi:shikimate kinase [Prosthecobacter sp.]|jgi:shikimate kinase/nucleoside-diphosphate-sugar epimerase|uniref:shikimate kinase n=1 Tax=Prosthecobacter sp. TaxID=1965333 RepID=UPI0037C5EA11
MKVLIAGCGFVGERVADLLHAAGHEVIGLTHSPESAARLATVKPWRTESCDISNSADVIALAAKLIAGSIDTVIHCASSSRGGAEMYQAVYVDGMRHLTQAFPAAFPLYTSSTSVYPQQNGEIVDETSFADPDRDTGRLLREAENIALDAKGTVARLAGIYGPGRSFVLKNLLEGKAAIEGNNGQGRILNQIHADDAASAVVHLVTQRLSGIYNIVDDAQVTQRQCVERLCSIFGVKVPGTREPDPNRKRGWSHKRVSNTKLHATGWAPLYASYFDALRDDPDLASSILDLVQTSGETPPSRQPNILLIGLMGSGKTTVGRIVAQMIGFQIVDTDHLIADTVGKSIPDIFATEGEAAFRQHESAALRSLLGKRGCVIATGGGIVTQPRNLAILRHLGYIVWLDADPERLARRTAMNTNRPLLNGEENPKAKLERLLNERKPLYKSLADLRIKTAELTPQETAYGVMESARVFFARRQKIESVT